MVTPYGVGGCVLTMETRVVMTDDDSRRRFRRYWQAAGPFIRLMRPAAMRALERQLGRGASGRAGAMTFDKPTRPSGPATARHPDHQTTEEFPLRTDFLARRVIFRRVSPPSHPYAIRQPFDPGYEPWR